MIRLRMLAVVAATALFAAAAGAEPTITPAKDGAPESAAKPAQPAKPPESGNFKQDVKHAWSETREGVHRAGRGIRDGAVSFGRATRDAFRDGWRKVKEAFGAAPAGGP